MPSTPQAASDIAFGRFRVFTRRRELLLAGRPVKMGGRAFDVLLALIEAPGVVVTKDELIARVWPGRVVEDNALQWQITALRKALGADRDLIRTVSGRGYQFTGQIQLIPAGRDLDPAIEPIPSRIEPSRIEAKPSATNLSHPISGLIGRDAELAELVELVTTHRLVTLTGPGGIGKTRLSQEAARRLLSRFADGVWFVELAPLAHPDLVAAAVAATAGVILPAGLVSAERVAAALADKTLLIVLDNCEHVIDGAALMVDALLHAAPAAHVLATSREPLRTEGEQVYPIRSLAVPAEDAGQADDPGRYGAVQLFLERARAADAHFAPDRRGLETIGAICRRLDGIPLAIELAAARTAVIGVEDLAGRLDQCFHLLTSGRRTALPRHRTLRATLDWSHDLLTVAERVLLRRLAVFAGSFSLKAVQTVTASAELPEAEIVEDLASLAAKSLVVADIEAGAARYRLLETTRAYAREKLAEAAEADTLARRHAEYYRDVFERAEAELETRGIGEWLADYAPRVDNLRTALDWAFSPNGDPSIGVAVTVAAVPLWMHLSLVEEARHRVEQAVAAAVAGVPVDAHRQMKLHAALGAASFYHLTRGSRPELAAVWQKTLELAESLGDIEYQMQALWGLWGFYVNGIDYRTALTLASRFSSLAEMRPNPNDRAAGERMVAIAHHFLGNQQEARRHIERAFPASAAPDGKHHIVRLGLDPWLTARVHLARILWLQGFPDQAMRAAEQGIEDARAAQHAISFAYALHRGACPVALWAGDLSAAGRYVDMMLDDARKHGLEQGRLYGRGYQGAVAVRRGDIATGLRLLQTCYEELGETGVVAPRFMRFAAIYMAEALGQADRASEALVAIDDAIGRAERTHELWERAELMRVKGWLLLLQSTSQNSASAESCFRHALDAARRQGALSWELRAATSLARLWCDQDRSAEARALLQPVYDRFTEGFETADLKAAAVLLDAS